MTHYTNTLGRTTRRIAMLGIPLLVAATGTAAAHGGGGYGGSMMGGGGWGLFGGGMGLWGLLWMGLLLAIPLYIAYKLLDRASGENDTRPLSVLRERYARGELTDEEFEQRRKQLEQSG
ncbi:SHOCT domain-containing protein [Halosolutus halophilus]|uniref:SHOCT domain-containing protein n=1 Tax=Halosolutus halophilus TaxID=1552990 RepID=UPI00223513A8|nr:SHOCT domain-containing protein [Halosolutus halophilus]